MRTHIYAASAILLLCSAGFAPAQTRDPLPVPDVAGYRTLKCDFHMHTVFSDGEVWPTTRVVEAWRDGLDAIAITDHAGYNPHKADLKPDLARPHAIAADMAGRIGLIVIPAVEFAEGNLHANALFVKDLNAFFGLNLADAYREARKQDTFVFWNHPGWKETAAWFPPIAAVHDQKLLQGVELVNGRTYYKEAFPWIVEKNLAIMANSDTHRPISPEYAPRERPVTLVFARQADSAGIREALFARRTAAWMGGELWGAEDLLKGIWGGAVKLPAPEISVTAARRSAGLIFDNRSAIPFKVKVVKKPDWLSVTAAGIEPEKIAGFVVNVAKTAPAGTTAAQIELEITNLHVAPDRNLTVTVPLRVVVN